jgi:hypothetical protein
MPDAASQGSGLTTTAGRFVAFSSEISANSALGPIHQFRLDRLVVKIEAESFSRANSVIF